MTKVTDPYAAAPHLMKQWMAVSLGAETVSYTHLTLPTICSV